MDYRLVHILELRAKSQQFSNGTLPFEQFLPALSWYSFDDEDDQGRYDPKVVVQDLPGAIQAEYMFYVKWRTSATSEQYKAVNWVYGKSSERYGWIDKGAYQREFAGEFRQLMLLAVRKE